MSTIINTPHVLMENMLGKNVAIHETWTSHCEWTRGTPDFDKAVEVARLHFEYPRPIVVRLIGILP